jgi:hypothetical protein
MGEKRKNTQHPQLFDASKSIEADQPIPWWEVESEVLESW